MRSVRKLIAWFDRDRAIEALAGAKPPISDDVASHVARWERARQAVTERPTFDQSRYPISDLPAELVGAGHAFCERRDVQAQFGGLRWRLGMVDLRGVVAYQSSVAHRSLTADAAVSDNSLGLMNRCLPGPPSPDTLDLIAESGHDPSRSWMITSMNPNLRVLRPKALDVPPELRVVRPGVYQANPAAPLEAAAFGRLFGFSVGVTQSFVQVAELSGRQFLRDGYHRCYGFLRSGITRVPCIIVTAKKFSDTGAEKPNFIAADELMGDHPPALPDFLDDAVAATVDGDSLVRVVRITAEEFWVRRRDDERAKSIDE